MVAQWLPDNKILCESTIWPGPHYDEFVFRFSGFPTQSKGMQLVGFYIAHTLVCFSPLALPTLGTFPGIPCLTDPPQP